MLLIIFSVYLIQLHSVLISPLFPDRDSPKFDFDLPKYDFLSSESLSNVNVGACDEGIEKEMLDIAIERSSKSEESSQEKE